jgi:hypothetical protein
LKDLFFCFAGFDEEIRKKLVSMETHPDLLMDSFLNLLKKRSSGKDVIVKLKKLYDEFLSETSWGAEEPNYLTHPIRVAACYIRSLGTIDYDNLALALCHNLKEKFGPAFNSLDEACLSARVKASIEVLTVDRPLESNPEYLAKFYGRIEKGGESLMLLKSLDKLDNILSWVLWDLEPYHSEVVLRCVCPRIAGRYSRLDRYMRELVDYVSTPEARKRFRLPVRSERA